MHAMAVEGLCASLLDEGEELIFICTHLIIKVARSTLYRNIMTLASRLAMRNLNNGRAFELIYRIELTKHDYKIDSRVTRQQADSA